MKNIDIYQQGCLQTESMPETLVENGRQAVALSLALNNIVELGKKSDVVKKHLFYKRPAPSIEAMANLRPEDWKEVSDLDPRIIRLLHCILGVQSELEELTEPVYKHITDGEELDLVNIMEELGDIAWYLSIGLDAVGFTFSDALHRNRVKLLEKRYKKGFSNDAANIRDLDSERTALETAQGAAEAESLTLTELLSHDSLQSLNLDTINNKVTVCLQGSDPFDLEPKIGQSLTDVLADLHSQLSRNSSEDCEDHT